ncbi:general transcription factor IIH subunit 3 isoform X6 [Chiloscyllium plagiosum]|uniref:general transcription factor IIH subunit 3 isoform X6 n=1 Tax=Chiloscyllium plagiosum TaxID=36176 RepID=UPI001CB7E4D8|nr:general transcription factor IIH subunit 3 isoform X6 [Chiloscyllium plagiosum]
MADDGDVSLLVIVVDVNPIWWGQQILKESQFTLSKCMDAVMVMGNSHLAMSRKHRLAIIASHSQESRFLYPGKQWKMGNFAESGDIGSTESNCSGSKDGKYELLAIGNDIITEEIKDLMSKTEVRAQLTETLLAGSLAKALCYIHKVNKELEVGQELNSRILVIKAAEDSASQYMNFMNVIFAAQKQWVFLPDPEQRSQLVLPPPVHVDYRAACFCHRNLIEIGYVCSVCLSIFCNFSPICTTCETAFRIALPPVLKTKKKKPKLSTHNYLTS